MVYRHRPLNIINHSTEWLARIHLSYGVMLLSYSTLFAPFSTGWETSGF